jgi:hypothetical protein
MFLVSVIVLFVLFGPWAKEAKEGGGVDTNKREKILCA